MNKLKGKKLLILGGIRLSCEIVRKAHELGCYVAVADYNPIEKSPGKQIADEAFEISVTDVDAVVALIQREKIDGVLVGFNDMLLPYYAEICKKSGLPSYGTKEQFEVFINKERYKALLRKFNVPTVEEYHVDLESFETSSESIRYPVLVKPVDSSGSRGVTICHTNGELRAAMEIAMALSKTGSVLVERYMEGREVTVFWVFQNGHYHLAGIANRHVKNNQEGVIPLPVGYTYPASVLPKYRAEIEENCKAMFHSVGLQDGIMFMQCKVEDGTCVVYDIGYRLTGTLEYKNFHDACGYNPLEMLIHFALTGQMAKEDISARIDPFFGDCYGFNVSCLAAPGTIAALTGMDEVLAFPEVIDAVISHYPGETITDSMKGLLSQITIRILGTAQREDELFEVMKRIEDTIQIISIEGEEMLLPGIELQDIAGYVLPKD